MTEENKKSLIIEIIFIIIFAIVAFSITIYMANKKIVMYAGGKNTNNSVNNGESSNTNYTKKVNSSFYDIYEYFNIPNTQINTGKINYLYSNEKDLTIDDKLSEFYYTTNNINITTKTYTSGDIVKEAKYGDFNGHQQIEIEYIEIDGLKNEEIENKINNEIKEVVFGFIDTPFENHLGITATPTFNASNILSVVIYVNDRNYSHYDGAETYSLNYDLTTGNLINFKDCFIENTPYKNILTIALYKCILDYMSNYDGAFRMKEGFNYEIEEITAKAIYEFEKGHFLYYITPSHINLIYQYNIVDTVHIVDIEIENFYNYITVFNKYLTKDSIFTNEYNNSVKKLIGFDNDVELSVYDNLLVLTEIHEDEIYNENKEDNLGKRKLIDNKINDKIEYTKNLNKDNMYIFAIDDYLDTIGIYNIECLNIEINKKIYEELLKEDIFKILRNLSKISGMELIFIDNQYSSSYDFYDDIKNKIETLYNGRFYKNYYIYDNYILRDSDTKLVNESDLKYLNLDELNLAYNEIFARHGHDFLNKTLKEYFDEQLWYMPVDGKQVSVAELNDIERQNIEIIRNEINKRKDLEE